MFRNWTTQTIRILVGLLFVFSGLIKVNDPHGFAYKLIEYFEVFQQDFSFPAAFFIESAFGLAALIAVFECVLGMLLLTGWLRRFTTLSIFGLIVFFTALTFYSWYFNKVQDCGCFGDFLHLTPYQSFIKDVVLLVLISYLFLYPSRIRPLLGNKKTNALLSVVLCASFPIIVLSTLNSGPVVDLLGACVGCDFKAHTENPNGPKGIKEWIPLDSECAQNGMQGWSVLVVVKQLEDEEPGLYAQLKDTHASLDSQKVSFFLTTASLSSVLKPWKEQHKPAYCIARNGGDVLKTIIRNNKGALLLKDGVVVEKWVGQVPDAADIQRLTEQ
ncbi:MAG: DoxX family protein [Bacteroidetes bacterium]|jgi:uncharacterized membrane protein YphA (DoxX/SURF4 family)|nr:DoxX family protein [Bacteroidota bacterium]